MSVAICVKPVHVDPVQRSMWYSEMPEVEETDQERVTMGAPEEQLARAERMGVAGVETEVVLKVAVQVRFVVMETPMDEEVDVEQLDQPAKVEPEDGAAVRVTAVPEL